MWGVMIHHSENYEYLCNLKIEDGASIRIQIFSLCIEYRKNCRVIMDKVMIVGASGHARVCLEILEAQGRKVIGFYDDDPCLVGTMLAWLSNIREYSGISAGS